MRPMFDERRTNERGEADETRSAIPMRTINQNNNSKLSTLTPVGDEPNGHFSVIAERIQNLHGPEKMEPPDESLRRCGKTH